MAWITGSWTVCTLPDYDLGCLKASSFAVMLVNLFLAVDPQIFHTLSSFTK